MTSAVDHLEHVILALVGTALALTLLGRRLSRDQEDRAALERALHAPRPPR